MKLLIATIVLSVALIISPKPPTQISTDQAIERAIPILQSSAKQWLESATCTSCHHQSLGSIAIATVRDQGFTVNEIGAKSQIDAVVNRSNKTILKMYNGEGAIGQFGFAFGLLGAGAENAPQSEFTDAVVHQLKIRQGSDGAWISVSHRQPLEDARETITAIAVRDLALYGGPSAQSNIDRAREWLIKTHPVHHEGRVMKLFGLVWSNASQQAINASAKELVNYQNADGGWSQLPGLSTDAYATGQATVALRLSNFEAAKPSIEKARKFLINTQKTDGTWHIVTRRKTGGLPYFETGFPYMEDQFISYAGSAWAVTALAVTKPGASLQSLTHKPIVTTKPKIGTYADSEQLNNLYYEIVHGNVAGMKKAIEAGADPNGKNLIGSTPLHWAVFDTDKTELLLHSGASADTVDQFNRTPVHFAAQYGTPESLKLVLAKSTSLELVSDEGMTALAESTQSFSNQKIKILLESGAKVDPPDGDPAPLTVACWVANIEAAKILLDAGASPDAATTDTVLDLNEPLLELLLNAGADPNLSDESGNAPLHYAAMKFSGNGNIVKLLLKAKANPTTKNRDGLTPLELAQIHKNKPVELLLSNK